MLSLRVTRDKRGYEHIYLIEESRKRGRVDGRLLYWSRQPGGIRVGREPFDDETRAALERAHPGVSFDWPNLVKTLAASAAQARWAARQERQGPAPPPRGGRRQGASGDRGRGGGRGGRDEADEDDGGDPQG